MKNKKAYFAGGCFWGVEYYFKKTEGVIEVTSGYAGRGKDNPTYEEVSNGDSGYVEAVEVEYDPEKTNFEALAKLFFEIHDPTQEDGQGPDIGSQYLSVIFYQDEEEKKIAEKLISILEEKDMDIVTKVEKFDKFYPAEDYHQDYYEKTGKTPYCHAYTKRF